MVGSILFQLGGAALKALHVLSDSHRPKSLAHEDLIRHRPQVLFVSSRPALPVTDLHGSLWEEGMGGQEGGRKR